MSERRERPDATPAPRAVADTGEGFVQRWSRRKHEARHGEAPVEAPPPPVAEPTAAPAARELTDADMPPVESLDGNSDYRPFLSPGVSEELRRLAFRKLFRLPEFSQRFELESEYYDCTNLEPLGSVITYDMREEMKRAAEKLAEALEPSPEPDKIAAGTSAELAAEVRHPVAATEPPTHENNDKPAARRRRRTRRTT